MRLALLLPVLFSIAAPAYAEGARESRYGPTTPRQASAVAAVAPYDGPMLGWASKRQASADAAVQEAPVPAQPAPMATWAGYRSAPAPAVQAPVRTAVATAPALPTSLYAQPRPAPVATAATPAPTLTTAPVPAKDWSSYRSTRMANAAPAPALVPAPAPAPVAPPPPRQVAAFGAGVTGARFYSVGRESGLTPDPIPPAGPDHQVLITADAPPTPPDDAAPPHGSADWLAAGVRGDDDDQDTSANRRAKTRNEGL